MTLTDTSTSYGLISRLNHWLVAAVVLALLGIGLYFAELPNGDEKTFWRSLHVAIGTLAFVFIAFRILWRAVNRRTAPFPQARPLQIATSVVHGVLMLGLAVMLITGPFIVWTKGAAIAPFGLFSLASPTGEMPQLHEILEQVHMLAANLIMIAVAVHVLGMLKHLIFERHLLIGRMLGEAKPDARLGQG